MAATRRQNRAVPLLFIILATVAAVGACVFTGTKPQLGLDLQGGASVVLRPTNPGAVTNEAMDVTIGVIRQRVDAFGAGESDVTRQGNDILVQLPGVKDKDRILALVGQTAKLQFRPVIGSKPPAELGLEPARDAGKAKGQPAPTTTKATPPPTTAAGAPPATAPGAPPATGAGTPPVTGSSAKPSTKSAVLDLDRGQDPVLFSGTVDAQATPPTPGASGTPIPGVPGAPGAGGQVHEEQNADITPREKQDPANEVVLPQFDRSGIESMRYLLGPSLGDGTIIKTASAGLNSQGGNQWVVDFETTGDGVAKWDAIAAQCYSPSQSGHSRTCPTGQLAIVLDGRVVSAPGIQTATFNGRGQITGNFTAVEAQDLAKILKFGSLPIELETQTSQTVSATLGKDSLNAGLVAGGLGVALVAIYMLLYYRVLGLVVILGLVVTAGILYSFLAFMGWMGWFALSLSGVIGVVVSIGVTVDSFIVYFERLKDEVHAGRPVRAALDHAFTRSFKTVLAANFTSFLGAVVLYFLTVGPVRGFAATLAVSVVIDVIVAWFFTRPLASLLGEKEFFLTAPFFGVARGLVVPSEDQDLDTEGAMA